MCIQPTPRIHEARINGRFTVATRGPAAANRPVRTDSPCPESPLPSPKTARRRRESVLGASVWAGSGRPRSRFRRPIDCLAIITPNHNPKPHSARASAPTRKLTTTDDVHILNTKSRSRTRGARRRVESGDIHGASPSGHRKERNNSQRGEGSRGGGRARHESAATRNDLRHFAPAPARNPDAGRLAAQSVTRPPAVSAFRFRRRAWSRPTSVARHV
jgi:hypothetical protein